MSAAEIPLLREETGEETDIFRNLVSTIVIPPEYASNQTKFFDTCFLL
jgi:hypothetical protein